MSGRKQLHRAAVSDCQRRITYSPLRDTDALVAHLSITSVRALDVSRRHSHDARAGAFRDKNAADPFFDGQLSALLSNATTGLTRLGQGTLTFLGSESE